jgi:transposase-like protein
MKMKAHVWERHVAAARQQNLSARVYADKHGLAVSTLNYWRRKLQVTTNVQVLGDTISQSNHASKFVALRVTDTDRVDTRSSPHCTLILAPGIRLDMTSLPDPRWLAELGRATQAAR